MSIIQQAAASSHFSSSADPEEIKKAFALIPTAIDTETDLISQKSQLPEIVCLTTAQDNGGVAEAGIVASDALQDLYTIARGILSDPQLLIVGQNIGYDMGVLSTNFPDLLPLIFQAYMDERVSCTMIREKLLTLATTGDLAFLKMPDGSKARLSYGMEALVKRYYNLDIAGDKNDPDSWRVNFGLLKGMAPDAWPVGAKDYACKDAVYALGIHGLQEKRRQEMIQDRGIDPLKTESFRVMVDFCLKLMSAQGARTDAAEVAKVEAFLAECLKPEKLNLLIQQQILTPAVPPQPFKRGVKDVCPTCAGKLGNPNCPTCHGDGKIPRMTVAKPESVNMEQLRAYVKQFANLANSDPCIDCGGRGVIPAPSIGSNVQIACRSCKGRGVINKPLEIVKLTYTDPTDRFPNGQLSVNAEFLEAYAHLDPVLTQYKGRQDIQKLVTTEIPRMKVGPEGSRVVADIVYPQYDPVKETGRVSSFSSKSPDYASFNCQNVDPRVRNCFVPRPGYLLFSVDFSQMELGTLAQVCYSLFGFSVLRDKINAGVDVHAYMGAQLARDLDTSFSALCQMNGATTSDQVFEHFIKYAKGSETEAKFFKHYRTFAKPTNLGYPGGLGPTTFIKFAKATYELDVSEEQAIIFRKTWKSTFTEMPLYFDYINKKCIDPYNKSWNEERKEYGDLYCYTSPYGMHRAGCDYCAAANGMGLQTPSAEGALTALITLVPATFKEGHILGPAGGVRAVAPWGFIHDEFVGEVLDDKFAPEKMKEVERIMVEGMQCVTPDVVSRVHSALMKRWDKNAEPVFDESGRLTVWSPK